MNVKGFNFIRNFGLLSVLLGSLFILYFQLAWLGYAVPLPYLWDVLCFKDCANDSNLNLSLPKLSGSQLLNYDQPIIQILGSDIIDKNKSSILIEKSKYRLTFFYDRKSIKSYPVVFGSSPVAQK